MPISCNKLYTTAIHGRFGVFNDTVNNITASSTLQGNVYIKNNLLINGQTITYAESIPPLTSNQCIITGQANDWLNGEYVVSSSNGSASAYYIFDKAPTVFEMANNDWVQILIERPTVITGYSIQLPTTAVYTNKPTSWTFQGSNDTITWMNLHTVTNNNTLAYNAVPVNFSFTNTTPYYYFRFTVLNLTVTVGIQDISIVATTTLLSTPPSDCTLYNSGKSTLTDCSVNGIVNFQNTPTINGNVLITQTDVNNTYLKQTDANNIYLKIADKSTTTSYGQLIVFNDISVNGNIMHKTFYTTPMPFPTTGTVISSQSQYYAIYQFNSNGTFTLNQPTTMNYCIVGSGGTGGNANGNGSMTVQVTALQLTQFRGFINGSVLTVQSIVGAGIIALKNQFNNGAGIPSGTLAGTGVQSGTMILSQISGNTGGIGTYNVSISQITNYCCGGGGGSGGQVVTGSTLFPAGTYYITLSSTGTSVLSGNGITITAASGNNGTTPGDGAMVQTGALSPDSQTYNVGGSGSSLFQPGTYWYPGTGYQVTIGTNTYTFAAGGSGGSWGASANVVSSAANTGNGGGGGGNGTYGFFNGGSGGTGTVLVWYPDAPFHFTSSVMVPTLLATDIQTAGNLYLSGNINSTPVTKINYLSNVTTDIAGTFTTIQSNVSTLLTNSVDTVSDQTINGNKTFSGNTNHTGVTDFNNSVFTNRNTIYLSYDGDTNHYLQYNGTYDGAYLAGYTSVVLGLTGYSPNLVVSSAGTAISGGLSVTGGVTFSVAPMIGSNTVATLQDVAGNYARLTNFSALSTTVSNLSSALSTTNVSTTSMSTLLSTHTANVASLSTAISTTNVSATSMSTLLTTHTGNVTSLSTAISTTNVSATSMSTLLATHTGNVTSLSTAISATNVSATSMSTLLATHTGNVTSLSTALTGYTGTTAMSTSISTAISSQNSTMLSNVTSLSTAASTALSSAISTQNSSMILTTGSLSTVISSHTSSLTSLSTAVAGYTTTAMSTSISTAISSQNSTMLSNVTSLSTAASTALSSAISTQNSSMISTTGSLSTVISSHTSSLTSLSTAVAGYTTTAVSTSISTAISTQNSTMLSNVTSLSTAASTALSSAISTQNSSMISTTASLSTVLGTHLTSTAVSTSISTAISTQNSTMLSSVTSLSTGVSTAISSTNSTLTSSVTSLSTAVSTNLSSYATTSSQTNYGHLSDENIFHGVQRFHNTVLFANDDGRSPAPVINSYLNYNQSGGNLNLSNAMMCIGNQNDTSHYLKYTNVGGQDGVVLAGYASLNFKLTSASISNNLMINAAGTTVNGSMIANNNFSVGGTSTFSSVTINGTSTINGTATFADIHVTTLPAKDTSTGVASTAYVRKVCIAGSLGVSSNGYIGGFPIFGSVSDLSVIGVGGRVDIVTLMPGWSVILYSGIGYTGSSAIIENRNTGILTARLNSLAIGGTDVCTLRGYSSGNTFTVTAFLSGGSFGANYMIDNPWTGQVADILVTDQLTGSGHVGTYRIYGTWNYCTGDGTKPAVFTCFQFGNGSDSWYSIKVYDSNGLEYTTNIS